MSSATPAPQSGGPALELLVHGVGGTTPEEMLGDPRTVRISGDRKAAVYRRTDDETAESRPGADRDRPIPEAYCWSNLTSGNSARALWLLLLPFMIANLAHWMRPRAPRLVRSTRLYGVLVRLIALTLTVLITAAACEVALDLIAWQCAGVERCADERSWLGFLSPERGGWWSQPGRRLALAAVVPAALVGLLWFLSNRTWSAYESQRPPSGREVTEGEIGPETRRDASLTPALGRPGFWYGRRLVARLRAAHTAAGLLTVAAAVAGAAARHDRGAADTTLKVTGWVLEGAMVLVGLVVLRVVMVRGRSERRFDARFDRMAIDTLPKAALALLGLCVVYALWSRPGWSSSGTLPGDATFRVLSLIQGGLVVALAVVAWILQRHARHTRTALYGLNGPAVAMLACALGGLMTAGVAQRVADWLDGPGTPGMDGDGFIPGPPVLLSWQASVIPVLLAVLLVPLLTLGIRTVRRQRALVPVVEREYAKEETDTGVWRPDRGRTRRIAGVRARAELTDAGPLLVGTIAAATLVLGALAVLGAWVSGKVPGRAFGDSGDFTESVAETAQSVGSWLVGLGFLLFVTLGRRAYNDIGARRTIGILWDVGTFWPRAAHPFAPPCYAERAVPDLAWRICTWIEQNERTGGRLVISGHSQGSVLAAAAVWQLPAYARQRVALLTHGSPLERLYGRWFPAYFGPAALAELRDQVDRWRNLWRPTDPIGGPVRVAADGRGPAVDRDPLKDPLVYGRSRRHPLPEPILGHGDYAADPAFAEERAGLLARVAVPPPRQGATPGSAGERGAGAGAPERGAPDGSTRGGAKKRRGEERA
ncbi:hypothetical protein ACFVIM_28205 [Streptomyces sp. NPDC057638]|uniref:hypothetical protein n=1 Tax=Streptomyces sp. NPDC057638 TaxID=3346190 RepID=UPI0036872C36